MKDDKPVWAEAVGAGLLVAVIASIVLVAAGGWDWFRLFLEGSAATWFGGLGSFAAAIVALYLATRSEKRQEASALEMALLFKVSLLDGIRAARFGARLGSFEYVGRARADLEQALAISEAVPMESLPAAHKLSLVILRSLNARCLHTIGVFLQVGDRSAFAHLESSFDSYHTAYFKCQGLSKEEILTD